MENIEEELQKIYEKNLEQLNKKQLDIDDLYQYFLEIQNLKKKLCSGLMLDWTDIPHLTSEQVNKKLINELKEQEYIFIDLIKDEILKKLRIGEEQKQNLFWNLNGFSLSNVANIDCTFLDFFPTVTKYKIIFESCEFIGAKTSAGEQESCFIPMQFLNKKISERLSFQKCKFHTFLNLRGNVFEEEVLFLCCRFLGGVDFKGSKFKSGVYFGDSIFKKKIIFSDCSFSKNADFGSIIALFRADFSNTFFEANACFSNAFFKYGANFEIYPSGKDRGFVSKVFFDGSRFLGSSSFENALFSDAYFFRSSFKDVNFSKVFFSQNVDFSQAHFSGKTSFKQAKFGDFSKDGKEKASSKFSQCIFNGDVDFSSTSFYCNTYFHRVVFHQNIQFYRSYFEGVANFYFADFKGIPNFSMCVFNQPKFANFVGVVLPQNTIDRLGRYITQKAKDEANQKDNIEKGRTKSYLCIQHSLNIRDSFRVIKETLIAQGNLLDTQQWHKLELYAKELEYQYRNDISTLGQEVEELKKQEQIKNPNDTDSVKTLKNNKNELNKNKIEHWQLWFYRQISDHHSNLAKIFNNVIMLIALFGIFAFGLDSLATHNFSTPKPPQKFIFGMLSKTPNPVAFWSLGLLLGAGILTEIRNIAKTYLKGIFLPFLWRSIPSMVLLLILCVLVCESFALLPLWLQETILIFGVCSSFVGIYLFLLWRESRVWIAIAYLVDLGILIFKPSLLLPFVGQLFDEGLKANFPAMQSLSVVYCILMFLMLFSLQKTARKNSIIPS